MSSEAVRLVIPAGDPYQPALVEGGTRVATRRGVSQERSVAFGRLVSLAVTAINTSAPRSIEMRIDGHHDLLHVVLAAVEPTGSVEAAMLGEFGERATDDAVEHRCDAASPAIEFTFAIG